MEKTVSLSKEEFIKFVKLQLRTLKVYFEEEYSDKPFQTAQILMHNIELERVAVPHMIARGEKLISLANTVLKLEEWKVIFETKRIHSNLLYSIVVRSTSGMKISYQLPKVKKSEPFMRDSLEPYVAQLTKRFFTLIYSILYNNIPKELIATKEEFLAHKGMVDLKKS